MNCETFPLKEPTHKVIIVDGRMIVVAKSELKKIPF